jgi:hypothetical protein
MLSTRKANSHGRPERSAFLSPLDGSVLAEIRCGGSWGIDTETGEGVPKVIPARTHSKLALRFARYCAIFPHADIRGLHLSRSIAFYFESSKR